MSDKGAVEILDDPDRHRFEIRVDGERAGFVEYSRKGDRLIFTHTEIDDAYEGKGLGSQLAQGALDAARAGAHPVVPLCPFIESYIERHHEYDDIVDHECLAYLEQKRERARPETI